MPDGAWSPANHDALLQLRGCEQQLFHLVCRRATPEQWSTWLSAPLKHAAATRDLGLVKRLLRAGATTDGLEELMSDLLMVSPVRKGANGDSTLHIAAALDHGHVVEALLKRGADPEAMDSEGRTPLRIAVEHGRLPAVRALLAAGADSGTRATADDLTALDFAAGGGDGHILRAILFHTADVNAADSLGCTALHRAALNNQAGAIDVLVEAGAIIDAPDKAGRTALHSASAEGSSDAVVALLGHGADQDALDNNVDGGRGRSPLHLAAGSGHLIAAAALVAARADVGFRYGDNEVSALDSAAVSGHLAVIEVIIPHVSDINATATDGRTVLHRAAFFNQACAIDVLVGAGADLEARDKGYAWMPVHDASCEGSSDAIVALLGHGAKKNALDTEGRAPLHLAAEGGHVPAVHALLAAGADCGLRYGEGELSALDLAVREAHLDMLPEIINHGDVNDANSRGYTALHHAAFWDEAEAVDALVEGGAHVGVRENGGWTPLHAAAIKGSSEAVRALLRHGVDPSALDGEGRAPLHLAAEHGHIYAAEALLAAGADAGLRDASPHEYSAFDLAALRGRVGVMAAIMKHGVDVNAADSRGCTALQRAASAEKTQAMHILVEAGARGLVEELLPGGGVAEKDYGCARRAEGEVLGLPPRTAAVAGAGGGSDGGLNAGDYDRG